MCWGPCQGALPALGCAALASNASPAGAAKLDLRATALTHTHVDRRSSPGQRRLPVRQRPPSGAKTRHNTSRQVRPPGSASLRISQRRRAPRAARRCPGSRAPAAASGPAPPRPRPAPPPALESGCRSGRSAVAAGGRGGGGMAVGGGGPGPPALRADSLAPGFRGGHPPPRARLLPVPSSFMIVIIERFGILAFLTNGREGV